ncbi:MAG: metabolite traffic protein EboE [Thermodesulfobacteriota bacterium]
MKLSHTPPVHLTYCLNIHPGESWEENLASIRTHALAIKNLVSPDRPFGLGLRLSARAAEELLQPRAISSFRDFLAEKSLYVFSVNAFPFGSFHGETVKEKVYAPDWRSKERLSYTQNVARILCSLALPEAFASISTVPGSYLHWIRNREDEAALAENLARAGAFLAEMEKETGNRIGLALEPEPDCFLENAADLADFFARVLLPIGAPLAARLLSCSETDAQEVLLRHLGACLDTCHMAVCFEDAAQAIETLSRNRISIFKMQLSAAPAFSWPVRPERLLSFSDSVYLHQARLKTVDKILRFADLEDAVRAGSEIAVPGSQLRVHCHVPIFFPGDADLGTTAGILTPELLRLAGRAGCRHFEVETYTFLVLPPELQRQGVTESIARELAFAESLLAASFPV